MSFLFFFCRHFSKTVDGATLPQRDLKVKQSISQQLYGPFDCASITIGWLVWLDAIAVQPMYCLVVPIKSKNLTHAQHKHRINWVLKRGFC